MNKTERKDEYQSLNLDGVKEMLKNSMGTNGIRANLINGGIRFATPFGEIMIPDKSIDYYYDIFKTNIQKAKPYEMYINEMDNIMNETDPSKLCKNLKEIINYVNSSEVHREKYSVITQWLNDGTITKEDMVKLYTAYGNGNTAGLDSNLSEKFVSSLKRNLEYYNILFKMFDIFDRAMFDGENVQNA